jgi:nitrite reductase/ring-hydroxylating ferredoxin subunit
MILNLWAVSLYVVGLVLRWGDLDAERTPSLPLLLSLGAAAVLSVSGYLGGKLIYEEGIAVGRHRRSGSTPAETIERFAEPGDWVAVAAAADVADGGTLRVAINGRVMTVARLAGACYAFQEVCTHRFGPLSEGAFEGDQVVCPWHRSCFDVRTGEVKQGPAKVPLRTFESQIREGQIWVMATGKEEGPRRQEE